MRFLHGKGLLDSKSSCEYLRLQLVDPGNPLLARGIPVQQVTLREVFTAEHQADGAVMLVMSWVNYLLARQKVGSLYF
jgi:hypothetical protein